MQFRWTSAGGAAPYDPKTGYGFVTGEVYNAVPALRIPETNSGFLPLWWYAGTPMLAVACTPYGAEARATAAVRGSDLAGRSLPVCLQRGQTCEHRAAQLAVPGHKSQQLQACGVKRIGAFL